MKALKHETLKIISQGCLVQLSINSQREIPKKIAALKNLEYLYLIGLLPVIL